MRAVALGGELRVCLVPARLWLAADSDTDERMVREDDPRHACEPRAPARRLARGVADRVRSDERRSGEHAGRSAHEQHAPQSRPTEDVRDRNADREERDEARLRIREEETGPQEREQRGSGPEADPAEPDRDEQHRDRDHDVTAEDARVLEQRGDAEVRRVRVRPLDVPCQQMPVGHALEEGDGGEEAGKRNERRRERAWVPFAPRRAANDDDEGGEGEEKEEELDAALAQIACPEQRRSRECDERGRGNGQQRRQRLSHVATQCAPGEREHRRGEHHVERNEEIRRLCADRDRDPKRRYCEQCHRHDRRIAGKRPRPCADGDDSDHEGGCMARRVDDQLEIRAGDQSCGQPDLCGRGRREAGQELGACARKEHRRRSQPADHRRQLGQVAMGHEDKTTDCLWSSRSGRLASILGRHRKRRRGGS